MHPAFLAMLQEESQTFVWQNNELLLLRFQPSQEGGLRRFFLRACQLNDALEDIILTRMEFFHEAFEGEDCTRYGVSKDAIKRLRALFLPLAFEATLTLYRDRLNQLSLELTGFKFLLEKVQPLLSQLHYESADISGALRSQLTLLSRYHSLVVLLEKEFETRKYPDKLKKMRCSTPTNLLDFSVSKQHK